VLDVEGYKSHREQMLQQLAQRMAERVTQTHKPAALEPMPAVERRIVHLTLRDHPHVRTESVGTGENRKVTIVPKTSKR
jgi:spoIIIJ-associated protein